MVSDRFVSSDTYNKEEAAVSMVQRHGEVPLSLTKKRHVGRLFGLLRRQFLYTV